MENNSNLDILNIKERNVFNELEEKRINKVLSSNELIEFAILNFEINESEFGFTLLEELIKNEPHNLFAKMWWLHFNLIYRGPLKKDVPTILEWTEELIQSESEIACAGFAIKADFLVDKYDRNVDEQIKIHQKAINRCPDWPIHHEALAILLEKKGRVREALGHYEEAYKRFLLEGEQDWSPTKAYFEHVIIGRTRTHYGIKEIQKKIEDLQKLVGENKAD